MYGTIAKFRVKSDKEAELRDHIQEFGSTNTRGFVASALYKADKGGQEYWLAVVFEDEASYKANAESPEQDARYQVMRSYLDGDPEWNDGEVIGRFTAGG